MNILIWLAVLAVLYVPVAGMLLAIGLRLTLTAGVVDWSGANKVAPPDAVTLGYRGDPGAAFGHAFETVRYETPLGPADAWMVPVAEPSPLWAIFVHGIGGTRENGYRQLRILHAAGVPVLMITYRNDPGAPVGRRQLYSFGLEEWPDLEAAVGWARSNGAERLVLVGESMGAAIIGQYLKRSDDRSVIAGLALDAPALDFRTVLTAGGTRRHVPFAGAVVEVALWLLRLSGAPLADADSRNAVADFAGPVHVAHGAHDPLVPIEISRQLVAARPETALLVTAARNHLESHAVDAIGYTEAFRVWLDAVRSVLVPQPAQREPGDHRDGGDDREQEDGSVDDVDQMHLKSPFNQG
ncbi:alpha/beta hydrolase [Devosia sp.]|uniref:alpha/beta hydrolase n=1 Tax=Devosia sp. TaxID=1871048 RepID=UPI003A8DE8CD